MNIFNACSGASVTYCEYILLFAFGSVKDLICNTDGTLLSITPEFAFIYTGNWNIRV